MKARPSAGGGPGEGGPGVWGSSGRGSGEAGVRAKVA